MANARKTSLDLRRRVRSSSDAVESSSSSCSGGRGERCRGPGGSSGAGGGYRVVVMGAAGVGKTAIIERFLYEEFSERYTATVEELHRGQYEVNGATLSLDILDTTGAYAFPAMRQLSIDTADAFVLVYSVGDKSSFDEVVSLRQQIITRRATTATTMTTSSVHEDDEAFNDDDDDDEEEAGAESYPPVVIVGNKTDLPDVDRAVARSDVAGKVSIEWNNGFVETSAKENVNINAVFKELLSQANVRLLASPILVRRKRRQSLPNNGRRGSRKDSCRVS